MQQPLDVAERVRMLKAAPSLSPSPISQHLVAPCRLCPRNFRPHKVKRGSQINTAQRVRQAISAAAVQHRGKTAGLPKVDWTRYHLQVLFVDK